MDKTSQAPELEMVDLGDAKDVTMGTYSTIREEDNPDFDAKY